MSRSARPLCDDRVHDILINLPTSSGRHLTGIVLRLPPNMLWHFLFEGTFERSIWTRDRPAHGACSFFPVLDGIGDVF